MNTQDISDIRQLLEQDLEWRAKEVAFLSGTLNSIYGRNDDETIALKNTFRKSLVLSLYAHFEGYFRYAFEIYAMTLNEYNIEINKVIDVLKVSSLNEVFIKYDDVNKWIINDDEFEKSNKRQINRLFLLQSIANNTIDKLKLPISADYNSINSIIYTESNLKPNVIDKILYRLGIHPTLGLPKSEFQQLMGLISAFVKKRNGLAHGDNKSEFKNGVSESEFNNFKRSYEKISSLIAPIITHSLLNQHYLKEEYRQI